MTTNKSIDNGVNAQALLDAREALTKEPAGAQFQWRATCKWINGTHSRSTVEIATRARSSKVAYSSSGLRPPASRWPMKSTARVVL